VAAAYWAADYRLGNAAFIHRCFTQNYFNRVTQRVYAEEIAAETFGTRQGRTETKAEFIAKKQRTARDYADAFIRYMRATQLVTVDPRTFRMVISAQRRSEVEFLLATVPREPLQFARLADFESYLFDPATLPLLSDNMQRLQDKSTALNISFAGLTTVRELQDLLEATEQSRREAQEEATQQSLKHYQQYEEVDAFYDRLTTRGAVPDAPLWLEWNIWRSLTMMNYASSIVGNYKADLDGVPLSTAAGNQPDLEADYSAFRLIVEVTMSSGQRQFDMEGESVSRHFGKARIAAGAIPTYCLFVAPTLNAMTLAHFFGSNQIHYDAYGGRTNIIPLTLAQFRVLIARGKDGGFNNPAQLEQLFTTLLSAVSTSHGETAWQQAIDAQVRNWLI
jgi:AlwI restriction endonuclease